MITLPTSWIYPGKVHRTLVRLKGLERDSLFDSFLTCTYPVYQSKTNLNDKFLYINRFKMSLISHNEEYKKFMKQENYHKILEHLSKDFEVNIYLMRCAIDDTLIRETYIHSDDSPIIVMEECDHFYPLGVNDKHGIHTMFFEDIDGEFRRSIEVFDRSGLSQDHSNEIEDKVKIRTVYLIKYNVKEVLNRLKHNKLK